ncbi:MAG: hypothetical protein Q9183_004071, partial [Haloplaca sp. 2 TL-2023]
ANQDQTVHCQEHKPDPSGFFFVPVDSCQHLIASGYLLTSMDSHATDSRPAQSGDATIVLAKSAYLAPALDACQLSNVGAKNALSSALLPQDRTISMFEGVAWGDVEELVRDEEDATSGDVEDALRDKEDVATTDVEDPDRDNKDVSVAAEEERSVVHRPGLSGKGENTGANGFTILEVLNGVEVISTDDVSIGSSTVISIREVEKGKDDGEAGMSLCMTMGVSNARKATVMFFASFMPGFGRSDGDQFVLELLA